MSIESAVLVVFIVGFKLDRADLARVIELEDCLFDLDDSDEWFWLCVELNPGKYEVDDLIAGSRDTEENRARLAQIKAAAQQDDNGPRLPWRESGA